MANASIWTGVIAAAAAISGVLVTTVADNIKERRKIRHDLKVKQLDREQANAARKRTFEIENLQAAYDGLWLLARESAKTHLADIQAARTTEHGYGGTLLPEGVESDIALTSQAKKAIRLILDDDVRAVALEATSAMGELAMLGAKAKMMNRGPVSESEAEAVNARVVDIADRAMNAIADRLRAAVAEE